jgi:DNA-binding NtrC family response regulator
MSPVDYAKPLVLCIDDSETRLRLRAQVLEKNGFSVLQASTATRALKLLRQKNISLVLSDHMLGETRGTELALEIKRLQPHVPVVLYSGAPPNSLANVDCFIQKDEAVDTVVAIIRDLVNRQQS